jgi:hypothetical protein
MQVQERRDHRQLHCGFTRARRGAKWETHLCSASVSGTARQLRCVSVPAVSPPSFHFPLAEPPTEAPQASLRRMDRYDGLHHFTSTPMQNGFKSEAIPLAEQN